MKKPLFTIDHSKDEKITVERKDEAAGIVYYTDGWWMTSRDYFRMNFPKPSSLHMAINRNYETKQLELDEFVLPDPIPTPKEKNND